MVGRVQNLTAFARYSDWHNSLTDNLDPERRKVKPLQPLHPLAGTILLPTGPGNNGRRTLSRRIAPAIAPHPSRSPTPRTGKSGTKVAC